MRLIISIIILSVSAQSFCADSATIKQFIQNENAAQKPRSSQNISTNNKSSTTEQKNSLETVNKANSTINEQAKDGSSSIKDKDIRDKYVIICGSKDVVVTIDNNSPFTTVFEDLDTKINYNISKNSHKEFCIPQGDHIDSFVKDGNNNVIHKMPIQHLMHYTNALEITVNQEGKISFDISVDSR